MPQAWGNQTAPTLADFQTLADEAWQRLPAEFRQMCDGLLIRIEDFPTEEVLNALDIDSEFDLLGLYQGISIDQKSVMDMPREPDMVFLYRRPVLDYWAEHEEALGHIIAHVLIHEIGHHFGLSDADMEAIEAAVGEPV